MDQSVPDSWTSFRFEVNVSPSSLDLKAFVFTENAGKQTSNDILFSIYNSAQYHSFV